MIIKDILPQFKTSPLGDVSFNQIQSDSRLIQSGDLFIAINCDQVIDNVRVALDRGLRLSSLISRLLMNWGDNFQMC